MKHFLYFFSSIILLSHSVAGQTLSADTDFREVVNKNNQMILDISKSYGVTLDKVENIKAKIHELSDNSSLSETQRFAQLNSFLGLVKSNNLEFYLQAIHTSWQNVQDKFPDSELTEAKIKDAIYEVTTDPDYTGAKLAATIFTLEGPDAGGECRDKAGYSLCVAGATAAAVVCQIGCTGGTFGFGALACAAICVTYQLSLANGCYRDYCK